MHKSTFVFRQGGMGRVVATAVLLCLMAGSPGKAQTISDIGQAAPSRTAGGNGTPADSDSQTSRIDTPQLALPAGQILAILQRNPDAIVEVKSVLADALRQKGISTQADSITDEQLYAQILSNPALRGNITYFLRARGYLSEEDLRRASNGSIGDAVQPLGTTALSDEFSSGFSSFDYPARVPGSMETEFPDSGAAADLPQYRPPVRMRREESPPPAPENQRNLTDRPDVLRRPAPYNLLALRDLYTQVPDSPEHLSRFGSEFFRSHPSTTPNPLSLSGTSMPLDIPLGPDYVLGPGDDLSISIWGGVSQTITRTIDRQGRIMLPESGEIQLAGLTLEKAQDAIGGALQPQFRNAHVAVTVARLRTVRIYVVGDVQRPGAYDITSLASPLTALIAAGGPTAVGSLRVIRHYRNQTLIGEIDLYDFLLHGIRVVDDKLQGGDTLLLPPVGPQIAVFGAVKRPAIYELRNEKTLTALLDDAGGLTVAAALGHITVDRIVANQRREEISLTSADSEDLTAASAAVAEFEVKDGDRVRVATVLPYSEQAVYLQGHVARPGKIAFRDGLRLSDVVRTYQDLLPEPAERGEIVRLVSPDLHPETIAFNLPEVLIGNANVPLQPFDTIRIFGRYEQDAPTVSVQGEVLRPGTYPLFEGMTAAQLVRAAGGFKRDALLDNADLISYRVADGTEVSLERRGLRIGAAVLKQEHDADAALKPGDVLTIHQLTGWNDIGASITIEGEVAHPGSYGFRLGEHLSDILQRAGGFRSTAYPEGAVLTRPEVAALEEKSRQELIRQIETSSAAARLSPAASGDRQSDTLQLIQKQQDQVLSRLKSQPVSGRLVIRIGAGIASWAGTAADIEVRTGDVLRIPKRPGFVLISGQVYNTSAITYAPGKKAGWYLERAGGATQIANRKEIFVIRANGVVVGRRSGGWREQNVLSTRLNPGDVIVVPQKIIGASVIWRNLLGTAQAAASIAIAASLAAGL